MHVFELQFHPEIFLSGKLPWVVWGLILLALLFDGLNGLHDAANSVATVVSTRVLSPPIAVFWAAFFNFVAFLVFPTKVAGTIQGDVIDQAIIDNSIIAATLIAACGWNVLTWYLGLPTSSSHALIGGMIGAALAKTGSFIDHLRWDGLGPILAFIVLAPAIGFILGVVMMTAVSWLFRAWSPRSVDRVFRRGQLLSAALFSLGHGGNDAQKTMGIIFALLIATSKTGAFARPTHVPLEVVLACHLAMGLGTMMGGWRIVKTMGQRIIHLRPVDGFCAETAAAGVLALTTFVKGIPISTTHTITGAIFGVGSVRRLTAVRWGVARQIVWAWVLTIPGSAVIAAVSWWLIQGLGTFWTMVHPG
jgi:PiT family inorganic phosphate transporter